MSTAPRDSDRLARAVRDALTTLLRELVEGPSAGGAFVLNRGDRGLLASLDALTAEAASAQPEGRSSVAAHVDHLRYGFELENRSERGESPWSTAHFTASWGRQQVTDEEWKARRAALAGEIRTWLATSGRPRDWTAPDLTEAMGVIVHVAYHLGAIRQIAPDAGGPPATD